MPRIVTLTTDFGTGSGYVAEMKGRLLHAREPFALVDISHDVPAHDIRSAAWLVARACFAFPAGALHLVVVDPGVGTARRLVWATVGDQQFLCPDNGVLSWALERSALTEARELAVPPDASATFHGRDAIAPAAIRLLDGELAASLGRSLDSLERFPVPRPRDGADGLHGEIVHVDAFGNLVTNLPASLLVNVKAAGGLRIGPHAVTSIVRTYGEAPPATPVVLVGSHGFIELAVVEGRADSRLSARVGMAVRAHP